MDTEVKNRLSDLEYQVTELETKLEALIELLIKSTTIPNKLIVDERAMHMIRKKHIEYIRAANKCL